MKRVSADERYGWYLVRIIVDISPFELSFFDVELVGDGAFDALESAELFVQSMSPKYAKENLEPRAFAVWERNRPGIMPASPFFEREVVKGEDFTPKVLGGET